MILTTERMTLEPIGPEVADELAVVVRDPGVVRWLVPDGTAPSPESVAASAAARAEHWRAYGYGLWLMRDRHTRAVLGRGGLMVTEYTGRPEVEVAWAVVSDRWGQGYATELAHAAVGFAFDTAGLSTLIAYALPHNRASRRVMEKADFRYERDLMQPEGLHVMYRRDRC